MPNENSNSIIYLGQDGGPSSTAVMLRLQLVMAHIQTAHNAIASAEGMLETLLHWE